MSVFLADEEATLAFGQALAKHCPSGFNIYLHGDLGAGKTTLVRGLIQTFLPNTKVKSPTYTLVEDYDVTDSSNNVKGLKHIYHFDLYRLGDPEELEYIGGRDYFAKDVVCLVEWPQRGEGWLTQPDLEISIEYAENSRVMRLKAHSKEAERLVEKIG